MTFYRLFHNLADLLTAFCELLSCKKSTNSLDTQSLTQDLAHLTKRRENFLTYRSHRGIIPLLIYRFVTPSVTSSTSCMTKIEPYIAQPSRYQIVQNFAPWVMAATILVRLCCSFNALPLPSTAAETAFMD